MWEWEVMGSVHHPPAWHLKARLDPGRTSQSSQSPPLLPCEPLARRDHSNSGSLSCAPASVFHWWGNGGTDGEVPGLAASWLPEAASDECFFPWVAWALPHTAVQEKLVVAEDLVLQVKRVEICMKHKVAFWVSQIRARTLLNLKCNCNFLTNAKSLLYSCSDCSLFLK